MQKILLMECEADQTRLALIEDGALCELYVERKGQDRLVRNVYAGRVANVLPGMQAAFVDIGLAKNGFLAASDALEKREFEPDETRPATPSIKQLVRPGQELMVQIVKVPGGDKGPRVTAHVTLPGRMLALLPSDAYIGVSHRIEAEDERERLRDLARRVCPEGMGLIVRTAAQDADEEALSRDVRYLIGLWARIRQRGQTSTAPALLYRDVDLVNRAVRDLLTADVEAFHIDDERAFSQARAMAEMISPALAGRIRFDGAGDRPLFDRYRVDAQAERALSRRVWLKSGGYLVFDYAEALTAVDVNTGKYVGKKSLSETALEINCEAAVEIARQLRLRDIGGIVIVDFVDMDLPEQR